jgi:hypothetical protein
VSKEAFWLGSNVIQADILNVLMFAHRVGVLAGAGYLVCLDLNRLSASLSSHLSYW